MSAAVYSLFMYHEFCCHMRGIKHRLRWHCVKYVKDNLKTCVLSLSFIKQTPCPWTGYLASFNSYKAYNTTMFRLPCVFYKTTSLMQTLLTKEPDFTLVSYILWNEITIHYLVFKLTFQRGLSNREHLTYFANFF